MTIRAKITNLLEQHGLWPEEAKAVMTRVEEAKENEPMRGRWDESTENYPPPIVNLAWFSAKTHAVEWIDENKPKHFARAILSA